MLLLIFSLTGLYADPLWEEAVSYFSHAEEWNAFSMEMESRQLDKTGKLKEFWEMEFILPPDGGEDDWEMVTAYKDGKPASEKDLEGRDNGMQQGPPGGYFDGVDTLALDPKEQERVTSLKTGKTVNLGGERVLVYAFTHTYESGAVTKGELYLTDEGFPVKMSYEFTNLPFYMKKMSNIFTFSRAGDAAIVDSMWMDGGVSFLFFNLNFMTKITFGDYQQKHS